MQSVERLATLLILLIFKFLLFEASTVSAHAQNTFEHALKMTSGGGSSDPQRVLVTVLQQCTNQLLNMSQSVSFTMIRGKCILAKSCHEG